MVLEASYQKQTHVFPFQAQFEPFVSDLSSLWDSIHTWFKIFKESFALSMRVHSGGCFKRKKMQLLGMVAYVILVILLSGGPMGSVSAVDPEANMNVVSF